MANKFIKFLNNLPGGPKGNVGDFQHAARIFVDNNFRLAPRHKFLYYVYFEIDAAAHQAAGFSAAKGDKEMSFLVKTAELPKLNFDSVTKNQYNRKKIVYKQINYEPVNLTFHDDNSGLMHSLYSLYYGYYVRDALNKEFDYPHGNRYPAFNSRYNMDIDITTSLFRRISLFTLSRHRFNEYRLLAPRIKNWSHGDVAAAESSATIENSMTIEYEGLSYDTGSVKEGTPDGFASLSYDHVDSPLTLGGGGLKGIAGALGLDVVNGIEDTFGPISMKTIKERPFTFISTAAQAINNYQKYSPGAGVSSSKILENVTAADAVNLVGGVIGAKFPKDPGITEVFKTVAAPKILNQVKNSNSFPQTFKGNGGSAPTDEFIP